MSSKLDQLKASFAKPAKDGNSANYEDSYPFWNMADGETAVIRFLPDADENNPHMFLTEKHMHTLMINGQRKSVPCPRMFGTSECPICELSAQYYSAQDTENGKKYWRNKQHIARVLVIKDPVVPDENGKTHEGEIRTVTLSFQIFTAINEAIASGELDEVPCDFEEGCNFNIKKKVSGGANAFPSYTLSAFARKSTPIDGSDIKLVELSTLLPEQLSYEKLEELLELSLVGGATTTNSAAPKEVEDKLASLKAKTTSSNVTTSDSNVEDEADAILASIMNNR